MKKKDYITLSILGVSFLFIRLLFLFSSVDKIFHWEELYSGTIAKQLIDGLILPFFAYQYIDYVGGSLFLGVWVVPFFLLFGQSYITLKLAHLSLSLGTLILWYLLLNKFFERKVAILACLLFILSQPTYIQMSLTLKGHHYESTVFTAIVIFIFYQVFFNKKNRKIYFILLGLISGFAVYFAYIFLITLFTYFLFWFIFDKKFFLKKNFLAFFGSFIIGFSPWIYYNLTYNFKGIYIYGQPLYRHFLTNSVIVSLTRLRDLIILIVPHSFGFENFVFLNGQLLAYIYYLIFVLSFCSLFWLNRKSISRLTLGIFPLRRFRLMPQDISKESFLVIYVVNFCLIYSFTNFELQVSGYETYKYVVPLFPFVFIIISLFLNKMWDRKNKLAFVAFTSLITILLSIGLIGNLSLISFDNFGNDIEYVKYEGFSFETFGWLIGKKRWGSIDRCIDLIDKVDKQRYKYDAYQGLGKGIAEKFEKEENIEEAIKLIKKIDKKYRPYVYQGLAYEIGHEWKGKNKFILDRAIELAEDMDENSRHYWYKGLGWGIGIEDQNHIFWSNIDEYAELINRVGKEYKCDFYRGFGIGLGEKRFGRDIKIYTELIERIDKEDRPYCYEGFRRGIKERLHTISPK